MFSSRVTWWRTASAVPSQTTRSRSLPVSTLRKLCPRRKWEPAVQRRRKSVLSHELLEKFLRSTSFTNLLRFSAQTEPQCFVLFLNPNHEKKIKLILYLSTGRRSRSIKTSPLTCSCLMHEDFNPRRFSLGNVFLNVTLSFYREFLEFTAFRT